MTILNRYDNYKLTLGKNVKETAQGFLVIPAYTARTGIQKYRMPDGTVIKEYRPEEEVFSDSSMSSLRTAAVTDGHPPEMVNPKNADKYLVGFPDGVIEKKQDMHEQYLATHVIITHERAIDAIKAGKAELSNGYSTDLDFSPGEYNGEKYDAIQRNIVNNHIAIVWKGRAGERVRLRMDSKDAVLVNDEDINNVPKQEKETMKLKIGDKEFDVADEIGNAVKEEMAKMAKDRDDAKEELNKMKPKADKADHLETEVEVLKTQKTNFVAKIDSLESDLAKSKTQEMDKEKFEKAVKERVALMDCASNILSKELVAKLDSMDCAEIKREVIKADSPNVDAEKLKDDSYVNVRFDHIVENMDKSKDASKKVGQAAQETRIKKDENNDKPLTSEEIRAKKMEQDRQDSLGPIKK